MRHVALFDCPARTSSMAGTYMPEAQHEFHVPQLNGLVVGSKAESTSYL
jgi:hypothetical protein